MNIVVCVKQVPDTTEIKIDPVTNTLIRHGVPSIVNTFDRFALELSLKIRDEVGGKVIVISMGPGQAKDALRECMGLGVDKAYLVSDRAFGGSDTLATSYVLSSAIRHIEGIDGKINLIMCGKQAIDGDTGQVGPEIAEHMDIPQITYVTDYKLRGHKPTFKRENDFGFDWIETTLPALITVTKTDTAPRYPTFRSIIKANQTEIPVLTSEDFSIDLVNCGLKGSPTKVKRTFTPIHENKVTLFSGKTPRELARDLFIALDDAKIL